MSQWLGDPNLISLGKMLAVMLLLLLLLRRKVNMGLAMIVSSIALGLLFQMAPLDLLLTALRASYELETLNLVAALLLILVLQHVMDLQRVVVSLKGLTGDHRVVVGLMPAIVGLLPTAGGAVFSAPLVDEASAQIGMSAEQKSSANYLLRHIWEYSAPIYPSVVLASQIFHVSLRDIILAQAPFTLVAIVAGALTAFRGTRNVTTATTAARFRDSLAGALVGLFPILAVIVLVIGFGVNLSLSLLLAVLLLLVMRRYSPRESLRLLRRSFSLSTVFLVLGVMVFTEVLTRSGALREVAEAMASLGVPPVLLFFLLPFVAGLLTGIAVAYVGVAFPLLLGIVGPEGVQPALLAFAFASGFAGVMLSPAHLCFVLTIQHFKADFAKVYRMTLVPQTCIVLTAFGLYLLHR
ncbi:MAG: DUF401 family protein [Chloroflexota bacterium]|nr:MAG: DUF401 family protein [Chloroflexota bacterium]